MIESFHGKAGRVADFSVMQPGLGERAFVQLVEHPTQVIVGRLLPMKKPKGQYHTLFIIAQHPSSLTSDGLGGIHYWQGPTLAAKGLSMGLLGLLTSDLLGKGHISSLFSFATLHPHVQPFLPFNPQSSGYLLDYPDTVSIMVLIGRVCISVASLPWPDEPSSLSGSTGPTDPNPSQGEGFLAGDVFQ